MDYRIKVYDKKFRIKVDKGVGDESQPVVEIDRRPAALLVEDRAEDGSLRSVRYNGRSFGVRVEKDSRGLPLRVFISGIPYEVEVEKIESTRVRRAAVGNKFVGEIKAILPGRVNLIRVKAGEKVQAGQSVAVLEAMKMENEITTQSDGIVRKVNALDGQIVSKGEVLIELDPL
ncbi:MAG: hypothetical protein PHC51_04950 [bacterium]|nr:hypothetical protein [bacterium]